MTVVLQPSGVTEGAAPGSHRLPLLRLSLIPHLLRQYEELAGTSAERQPLVHRPVEAGPNVQRVVGSSWRTMASVLIACQHSISAPPGAGLGFPPGAPTHARNAGAPGCLNIEGYRSRSGDRRPGPGESHAGCIEACAGLVSAEGLGCQAGEMWKGQTPFMERRLMPSDSPVRNGHGHIPHFR